MEHFWFTYIMFYLLFFANPGASAIDHVETRLLAQLFGSNYDPRARPPYKVNEPVYVDFWFNLDQIYDVNERSQTVSLLTTTYQEWKDPRLKWNASDFDGLDAFSIFYTYLWTPDTTLYNTVEMYDPSVQDRGNANVRSDGDDDGATIQVEYNTRCTIGCRFNMRYFPFDEQNCTFIFGSWTYDQSQVNYSLAHNYVTTEDFRESDEWTLVSFEVTSKSEKYLCCKHPYQVIYAHLVMRRKSLYYIFNLVLPTVIINIMASFGLFASAGNSDNRHDKLQVGITALLSYCILLLTVSDQIPKGSADIPLIGWFFFSMMLQNAVKMYLAVFLSYPGRRKFVMAIGEYVKNKLFHHMRNVDIVRRDEMNFKSDLDDEDRWPEVICLCLSVGVLGVITIVMFAVAHHQ